MKKDVKNTIFVDDYIRRKKIFAYLCYILLTLIVAVVFLLIFINKNTVKYAKYDESSDIKYNVYLKENEFFSSDHVTSDKQYISTLIDYISATYNYKLKLDNSRINYKYSYRITAEVNVRDKNSNKVIYNFREDILPEKIIDSNNKELVLSEGINIDYNKYNDLVKKFIAIYDIGDVTSSLDVNMHVGLSTTCDDNSTESVIGLSMPLTLKTMGIDINNKLINSKDNVMICNKPSRANILYLFAACGFAIITAIIAVRLSDYASKTVTAKSVYQKELKKILDNHSKYIEKVNGSFSLTGYQVLTIDTFTDMLEIRNTLKQPILMVENVKQTGVFFIIPSNTKLLYVYAIRMSDIEKELKKNK